jgi:hypothetical protein
MASRLPTRLLAEDGLLRMATLSRIWSATAAVVVVTAFTPYLPFARLLGFEALPTPFYPIIALIIVSYIAAAEITKRFFYRSARLAATTVT